MMPTMSTAEFLTKISATIILSVANRICKGTWLPAYRLLDDGFFKALDPVYPDIVYT